MTRINIGINPKELCDQHLIAEYKELPRCFKTRTNANLLTFRLNKGHQLWCAQFQRSLMFRQHAICEEMKIRNFNVNFYVSLHDAELNNGREWTENDEKYARPIVQRRILDRLITMAPKWTNRTKPCWVVDLV